MVVAVAMAGLLWAGPAARSQEADEAEPGGGQLGSDGEVTAAELRLGGQVYALQCAMCHGSDGAGMVGAGRFDGPAINDVDVAYVDLTLRTGRMPLRVQELALGDRLGDRQRRAVVAWMQDEFDLPGGIPQVGTGTASRGQALYTRYCAACHGSTGAGGVSAEGTLVRPVLGVDPVGVAEAIRVGPFRMPAFDEDVLGDGDVADIAAYVAEMTAARRTPLGLSELDRVEMAALVVPLVVAMLGIVLVVARPVRRPEDPAGAEAPGDDPQEDPAVEQR